MTSSLHDRSRSALERSINRRNLGKVTIGAGAALGIGGSLRAQPSSAQDTVTVSFMHWGSAQEKDVLAGIIKRFEEANPTIKVDQQFVVDADDAYNTKINTLLAADDLPDLFYLNEARALQWGEQGVILDMTPYMDKFANKIPQTLYYYAPGKLIGGMGAVETTLIFANKEIFEKTGVALPPTKAEEAWNWDQLIETAKQLTLDREGRNATDPEFDADKITQYGLTFPTWWLGWYPLIRSNGGDVTDEAGTTCLLNAPEAVEIFQKLQDLIYVHHVAPTPTAAEGLPASAQQLQTGRVAMTIDGQWALLDMAAAKVPLALGVLPVFKTPVTNIVGATTVVSPKSDHLDAALAFYFFLSDSGQVLDLCKSGLWMPTDATYYTDETLIASWTDNEVHPPEYKEAAMDYVMGYSVIGPILIKDWSTISSRLDSHLDKVWSNDSSAQEALDAATAEIQPMLTGRYPTS
ncbi:MAG: ABC transporter substrate-binding protein [Thermomicrobiales bacterium]